MPRCMYLRDQERLYYAHALTCPPLHCCTPFLFHCPLSSDMHRIFQRDLCKLRLSTARSFVKVITDGQGPLSSTGGTSLRLDAKIQGLGPLFRLKMVLKNTGARAVTEVPLTFGYNRDIYRLDESSLLHRIPILVPGVEYHFEVAIECVDPNGAADQIRVFICNNKSVVPAISAIGEQTSEQREGAGAGEGEGGGV
jgi:hypothetical protein